MSRVLLHKQLKTYKNIFTYCGYNIYAVINYYIIKWARYADKGLAPLNAGHEPIMLLLHQPALSAFNVFCLSKLF